MGEGEGEGAWRRRKGWRFDRVLYVSLKHIDYFLARYDVGNPINALASLPILHLGIKSSLIIFFERTLEKIKTGERLGCRGPEEEGDEGIGAKAALREERSDDRRGLECVERRVGRSLGTEISDKHTSDARNCDNSSSLRSSLPLTSETMGVLMTEELVPAILLVQTMSEDLAPTMASL